MPTLKNPKYEAFAVHYATTGNAAQSYISAGFKATNVHSASASAAKLFDKPEVLARIEEIKANQTTMVVKHAQGIVSQIEAAPQVILARDLVQRVQRVGLLCEYAEKIEQAMRARAKDPTHQDIPGIETGVVAVKYKVGKDFLEKEYEVDTNTIRELRAVNEQIAKELGQWVEKQDVQTIKSERDIPDSVLEDMLKKAQEEDKEKPN